MIQEAATSSRRGWDAVVVGAGIGGLTTAAFLARTGASVLVCEQHYRAGGFCTSWNAGTRIDGGVVKLTFDAAVHDISGTEEHGTIRRILCWLGIGDRLEWARNSHEYRIGSTTLRVAEGPRSYVEQLKLKFPGEAQQIERFFSTCHACYEELYRHARFTGDLPRAPLNAAEMRRFREECPTLKGLVGIRFCAYRDSLLTHPELRQFASVLAAYITDDVDQLTFGQMLPLFGYYFRGGHYPRGGSQALADILVDVIKANGGEVRLRTPVLSIREQGGRACGITLKGGAEIDASIVISNADPPQTFERLVTSRRLHAPVANMVAACRSSNSAFMLFLGLKGRLELPSSTILVRGDEGLIISCPPFPEARAPEGYSTITLTSLVAAGEVDAWDRTAAGYHQRKRALGDRLLALATERVPELAHRVIYRSEGTPATIARFTWATGAAAYGLTPQTRWSAHETAIVGLYVVGAGTGLGPGIEAVMVGGASLGQRLCGNVPRSSDAVSSFGVHR